MESYIFGQLISGINFNETPLCNEYEQCIFKNCIFHNCNLSHKIFRECKFESCDLSLSKMNNTTLSEIDFLGCKILGVQFNECRRFLLSFRFENCSLRLSVFYNLKLKEACFNKCDLQEADFTETDLTNASFQECNLYRAIFDHANLEKADFRTSNYYSINPETNRLKGARFSLNGLPGLLERYGIIIE